MKILRFFLIFISILAFENQALAAISLSVNNEEIAKTKILFFGFDSLNPNLKNDAATIAEQINKDLKTTGLFAIVRQEQASVNNSSTTNPLSENLGIEIAPNFEKYGKLEIGVIVNAQFDYDQIGNLEVRVRAWDVLDQRQLFGKFYTASKDNYRKVSNMIADEIFKSVSGETVGHFNSQILYVSESGLAKKRVKKINLINFDGSNNRVLTDGRDLVLTPVFSKKRDEIFYLRYFENKPQIFSLDTKNLRIKKTGSFRATTFAPAVHPTDPNIILLSAIFDGNSDIYQLDIANNKAKRLTSGSSIETTPSFSPDAKSIAFSSDRDSGQQIYIMDADGSSIRRLTSNSGTYSKPVWSPDGKLIAFTKIKGGEFFIGVISPSGKGEKLLASGYLVEGAKWSPNGRYLIYSKRQQHYGKDSVPRLYIVDIITGFEFEIPTPEGEGATDPDWI